VLAGVYAFATLTWLEATHLFSHVLVMATVLGATWLAVRTPRLGPGSIVGILALLGLAAILEIHAGLFLPILAAYVLRTRRVVLPRDMRAVLLGTAAFLAIYAVLIVYNHAVLGEITAKSNKGNPAFPFERSYLDALSGNPLVGLDRVLTSFGHVRVWWDWSRGRQNDTPGLLVVMPVLLLSIPGFVVFWRRQRPEAGLFLLLLAAYLVVGAFKTVTLTRYVTPVLPFLFVPLAFVTGRRWVAGLLAPLALVSLARVLYHMNAYHGRSLADPFPYLREWPSLLLGLVPAVLLALVIASRPGRATPAST
jgi:hypothetical protein